MKRCRIPLLVVVLGLVGCQPRDPLDWKVDARTLNDFNYWASQQTPRMPPALGREFTQAIGFINHRIVRARPLRDQDMRDENDPFCRTVNGLSVRNTIINGYLDENATLGDTISLTQNNLLRLLKNADTLGGPEHQISWEVATERERLVIEAANRAIAKNNARIAALSAPTP